MKKVVKTLALPLFASLILAACGGNEGGEVETSSSATPTVSSSVETPSSTPVVSSSEAPVVSSSTPTPAQSSSAPTPASSSTPTPASSSSQEQHEHSYGDWTVVSEPTETEDGVESRTCSCGDVQTRPIPRKQINVDYGFVSESNYTLTTSTRGLSFVAEGGDAYGGVYRSIGNAKVTNAIKYTFKIKNDGTERIELRFGYRDTTVNPRVFSNSADVSGYTIASRDGSSNTKIREVKDGYFRINIAAGDIADVSIPMTSNKFDQFVLTAVHSTKTEFTIIETGYVLGDIHYSDTYSTNEHYHWKASTDEGLDFISEKGEHEWVADTTKTDVPATTESEGIHYEVCSVCGETREVVIPRIGAPTYRDVDMLANGIDSNSNYTVTAEEGGKYKVDYTQPAGGYLSANLNGFADLTFTKAEYAVIKLTNLGEDEVVFCPTLYKDSSTSALVKGSDEKSGVMLSSTLGTSSFERVGSNCGYCHVGAGDTAEFKLMLIDGVTSFAKARIMCDSNPSAEKSGSIELISWTVHDNLAE